MASSEVSVKCASNLWILLLLAPAMSPILEVADHLSTPGWDASQYVNTNWAEH